MTRKWAKKLLEKELDVKRNPQKHKELQHSIDELRDAGRFYKDMSDKLRNDMAEQQKEAKSKEKAHGEVLQELACCKEQLRAAEQKNEDLHADNKILMVALGQEMIDNDVPASISWMYSNAPQWYHL